MGPGSPWESIGPGRPGMLAGRVIRGCLWGQVVQGCLQAGSSGDACRARLSLGVNKAKLSRDACRLGHKGMPAGPGHPWVSTGQVVPGCLQAGSSGDACGARSSLGVNRARASQDACRPDHQGMPAGPGRHEVPARPGHQGMPVGLGRPWESIGPGHPGMLASRVIRGCLQAGSSGDACEARSSLGVNRQGHPGMSAGWVIRGCLRGRVVPGCQQARSSRDACRPGHQGMPAGPGRHEVPARPGHHGEPSELSSHKVRLKIMFLW